MFLLIHSCGYKCRCRNVPACLNSSFPESKDKIHLVCPKTSLEGQCTLLWLGPYLVIISFSSSLFNYYDAGGQVLPLFIMKKAVEKYSLVDPQPQFAKETLFSVLTDTMNSSVYQQCHIVSIKMLTVWYHMVF